MARKPARKPKPKLTYAERYGRMVAMVREVQADERAEAFEDVQARHEATYSDSFCERWRMKDRVLR